MPFLNTALLDHMVKILPSFDAIVPRWPNMQKEPLHAVYSLSCLPTMKKHLENNRYSIIHVLKEMHVLHLNKRGFSELDPEFYSFLNINDQADIDLANKIAAEKKDLKVSPFSLDGRRRGMRVAIMALAARLSRLLDKIIYIKVIASKARQTPVRCPASLRREGKMQGELHPSTSRSGY